MKLRCFEVCRSQHSCCTFWPHRIPDLAFFQGSSSFSSAPQLMSLQSGTLRTHTRIGHIQQWPCLSAHKATSDIACSGDGAERRGAERLADYTMFRACWLNNWIISGSVLKHLELIF